MIMHIVPTGEKYKNSWQSYRTVDEYEIAVNYFDTRQEAIDISVFYVMYHAKERYNTIYVQDINGKVDFIVPVIKEIPSCTLS